MNYPKILFIIPTTNIVVERAIEEFNFKHKSFDSYVFKIKVDFINYSKGSQGQFNINSFISIVNSAKLLELDMIVWAGTSGSWLGLDYELKLIDSIRNINNCEVVGCYSEIINLLIKHKISNINLLTPYEANTHNKIIENFQKNKIMVDVNEHYNYINNYLFSTISEEIIYADLEKISISNNDIIIPMCTNIWSYKIIDFFERNHENFILDPIYAIFNKIVDCFDVKNKNNLGNFFAN